MRRSPRFTRPYTLFPYKTLFRSAMHYTHLSTVFAMQDRRIIRINHYSALTSAVDPRPAILLPETCPFSREQKMTHLQPQRCITRMWQRCLRCKIDSLCVLIIIPP